MRNLQRILFLIVSILIIVIVLSVFDDTEVDISNDNETQLVLADEGYFVLEKAKLYPPAVKEQEEVSEMEQRYVEDVTETEQEIAVTTEYSSVLATEEEIIMLAKVIQVECGGIPSDTEQSCVAWTVLNHVDSPAFPNTIAACITQPGAFAYRYYTQASDHSLWLARDVVSRWEREKAGETNVGRTLPQGYFSFWGDGVHNYFRVNYNTYDRWDYSLGSPYSS